ncbi:hypothetical protein Cch01nite_10980 [Cellulomonas chitinilytica]|uniref:Pilus assembly protein PilO n=1 Tax=Cellulomonas chitinilytica TaxID=398759 RepID=A0A919P2R8_9CELL|nr:type 4a pilus biogenesis protein PilO [Cellulomonas chitinilytica]GIG20374.1 hypothetical protein Cch01nite_10980 [Cellulomonas chitinilytica]
MVGAKKSTWVGGAVFVALVILAAAWFLAISPKMSSASDVRDQAEQTRQQNELLQMQVAKLKAEFEKLPEYKTELAALQTQIPTDVQLSEFLRQLDQIAVAHSVTITTLSPAAPTAVAAAVAEAPAPAPADGSTEAAPADGAADDAAGATVNDVAAALVPPGFTAIPVSITVLGSYDNTTGFLYDLQNVTPRLFLVTGFTGTAQKDNPASGGKPATSPGDQELLISGLMYSLPDPLATPPAADPAATPAPLQGAVPGKNPLVPIQGR